MLKQKILVFLLIGCALTTLIGCSDSDMGQKDDTDWFCYADRPGMLVFTDDAYLFYNPEWQYIQAMDLQCSAPAIPICTKAECTHSDSTCSAYVELPTYFYGYQDKVYYIASDSDGKAGLYSMNITGEKRRQETELPQLDLLSGSISYNLYINDGYMLLSLWKEDIAAGTQTCQLFLYDLNQIKDNPVEIFYDDSRNCQVEYHMYIMDGWAIYGISRALKSESETEITQSSLYAYEIATGQTVELVQDWSDRNSLSIKEGMLYWCAIDKGIYSVDLATGEEIEYRAFDTDEIMGSQGYDDQYIYLSYLTDDPKVVIYDYEGNLITEITVTSDDVLPIYFFCSKDRAYFSYIGSQGADLYSLPVCYLNKADLAKGTAEFVYLDEQWN